MKDKTTKRNEANARNAAWANQTNTEKFAYLDKMGYKATKQRAKILESVNKK